MKQTGFSNLYRFMRYSYEKNHHTDAREGAQMHYLAYMERGHCRIVSDRGTVEAEAGEAFYIPMGLPYQSYWYGEESVCFRSYGFAYFPEAENRPFRLQKLPAELSDMICRLPLARYPGSEAMSDLYCTLAALAPRMEQEHICDGERILDAATEYMHQNPNKSIPEVARHCCVSESALYGVFKRLAGRTPNDVKLELLTEKAVRLLCDTNMPVVAVSDALAFSSPSYFRKILKKYTGKTPRQIRKEVSGL